MLYSIGIFDENDNYAGPLVKVDRFTHVFAQDEVFAPAVAGFFYNWEIAPNQFAKLPATSVELISGEGDSDNFRFFTKEGSYKLFLRAGLSYEPKYKLSIRVRVQHNSSQSEESIHTITLSTQALPTPDMVFSRPAISCKLPNTTPVGYLSTGSAYVYSISLTPNYGQNDKFELGSVQNSPYSNWLISTSALDFSDKVRIEVSYRLKAEINGRIELFDKRCQMDILPEMMPTEIMFERDVSNLLENVSGTRNVGQIKVKFNDGRVYPETLPLLGNPLFDYYGLVVELVAFDENWNPLFDASSFRVTDEKALETSVEFDYETKTSYNVRISASLSYHPDPEGYNQYCRVITQDIVIPVINIRSDDVIETVEADLQAVTDNGIISGTVETDPTKDRVLVNGQALPEGSIIKNTVTNQNFIKVEGDEFAFVAIAITPSPSWGWSSTSSYYWQLLQNA